MIDSVNGARSDIDENNRNVCSATLSLAKLAKEINRSKRIRKSRRVVEEIPTGNWNISTPRITTARRGKQFADWKFFTSRKQFRLMSGDDAI